MIKLHGFPVSNYHNKIKFAMLEKGIAFEEVIYHPRERSEAALMMSPLGKVPFMSTEQGAFSESHVMMEYLEELKPRKRHFSKDAFVAAKQRELNQYLELHLELVARELYGAAFFNMEMPSDSTKARVEKLLVRNILAFKGLAKFAPFVAGEELCAADFAAYVHLPLVALATKAVYGRDFLVENGIDWKAYLAAINTAYPASTKRISDYKKAYLASQK